MKGGYILVRMPDRRFLTLPLLAVVAVASWNCGGDKAAATGKGPESAPGAGKKGGKKGGGDVPVVTTQAVVRAVPIDVEVIGNVEASSVVTMKPQVSGELVKVLFNEGDFVNAGTPMFEIDRRTIDAQLQQAQANLARSEALLRQAQANLARDTAQADYSKAMASRVAQLAKEGVASKEQTQQADAAALTQHEALGAGRAAIESARADIAANKATIENLQVQRGYTTLRAPQAGRTGTLLVKRGNVVSANQTELVVINQLQPVNVLFSVPESQLGKISNRFGKEKIPVYASPQDQPDKQFTGLLTFFENTVDAGTGTIKLRATFPNTDRQLWPGQFVRVRLRLGTVDDAVVVPNQAVQTGQDGSFIYVVKPDRTVEARPVTSTIRTGQDLVIASGLAAGETIVTEGQLRLAPGLRIAVRQPGGEGKKGKKKKAE